MVIKLNLLLTNKSGIISLLVHSHTVPHLGAMVAVVASGGESPDVEEPTSRPFQEMMLDGGSGTLKWLRLNGRPEDVRGVDS